MTVHRRPDLDAAKGWGMFLVVLGHATPPEWVGTLIYGFHMPLFFVISGLLWKGRVRPSGVLRSLMWTFWLGSFVTWPFWVVKVLAIKPDGVPLWGPLLATAYGGNLFGYLVHNSALWFLPALFGLFMVIWLVMRFTASCMTLSVCLFALGGAVLLLAPWIPMLRAMPLSLGQGLVGGLFFAVGLLVAGTSLDRAKAGSVRTLEVIFFLGFLAVFLVTGRFNGRVDLFTMQFGEPLLYLFNGLLGTALLLALCRQSLAQWAPIRMIGARSIHVLVFHQPLLWGLRFVFAKVYGESNCIGLAVATLLLFLLAFKLQDWRVDHAKQRSMQEV